MHPSATVLPAGTVSPNRRSIRGFRRFIAPLLLLLLWQSAASMGLISARAVASPLTVALSFWTLLSTGELLTHLLVSLARVAVGLGIGIGAGVFFALVAGLTKAGEDSVDATLQMIRTLPHLALVPLFILWFGIGETPKILLIALGAAFPIYLNLFAGIRGVDAKIIEAARTLGLSRTELIVHVILPGALPAALVGLRYSLGVAWLSLVVAEQINASSGIGYLVMTARDFLRTDIIFVGLITYAMLGLAADQLVRTLERAVLVWRPSFVKD